MEIKTPKIREITADTVLEEIQRKAPFYVPEWTPGVEGDFGAALSQIFANMVENIVINLNDVPRKHLYSFLDMLNFSLNPALPARTILCFLPGPGAPENVVIPARTQATAKGPEGEDIFFETEKIISLTPSKLCSVFSLCQRIDAIFDHSSTIEGINPSVIFSGRNMQEHLFYIGDEQAFGVIKGTISFTLEALGTVPARLLAEKNLFIWEYASPESEEEEEITEWRLFSADFSNGQLILLKGEEIIGKGKVNNLKSRWIRCRLNEGRISQLESFVLSSIKVETSAKEVKPDLIFYNDIPLEEKGELKPFGSRPNLYDTFYVACFEVFSRQGCEIGMDFDLVPGRSLFSEKPLLSWEYWDGESWRNLKKFMTFSVELEEGKNESENDFLSLDPENFLLNKVNESENGSNSSRLFALKEQKEEKEEDKKASVFHVCVKIREIPRMMPGNVNGSDNYWIRVRLIDGNFGKEYVISKKNTLEPGKFYPPLMKDLKLNYYDSKGIEPEYLVSKNNLTFENLKQILKLNEAFKPFKEIQETLPAIYFGFTSSLVKGPFSLFTELEETVLNNTLPIKFKWQYFSGKRRENSGEEWQELQFLDETEGLAKRGILEFYVPGEIKPLKLHGSENPLYWIRLLFTEGKRVSRISGLYTNCVWALQARTIESEILGSSLKEAGQKYQLINKPVVNAEIWVNEAAWLPEREKLALLKEKAQNVRAIKKDSEKFSEFWIKWEEVNDFTNSEANNRHYLLDRGSGKVVFGDGKRGMLPPLGMDNIEAGYQTGGGETGNLDPFSITNLYSAVKFVDGVYNPAASEGGSGAENMDKLVERATVKFKHRDRAVNREDIISLTKEAAKKVAKVNVLSGLDETGKSVPGLMTVIIVPDSPEQQPFPASELVQIVETYLKERAPAIGRLKVTGPFYYKVNAKISLITTDSKALNEIEAKIKTKIEEFLHPLKGGKKGTGWEFGQLPSDSDFYLLLSNLNGVSYIKKVDLTFKNEKEDYEMHFESLRSYRIPKSALPCSGKHEINVFWQVKGENEK